MTEDEKQRLRKVEDAIISFDNIAKIVIVDMKERIKALEKSDEDTKSQIYQSCDTKSKEIDKKIKEVKDEIFTAFREEVKSLQKMFIYCLVLMGAMFLLFIGAVVYFNNQDGKIYDKINFHSKDIAQKESKNATNIASVLDDLKYIRGKIDANVHNHHKEEFIKKSEALEKINHNKNQITYLKGRIKK